jgi:geranylgeranyl reductase family protein
MDACDVLIVGGGPAGSSCAWRLRNSGLAVAILDKEIFPRDKVCGGWITPAVLEELEINAGEYACGRVLQPITGFRVSRLGGREVEIHYAAPVSYGIRRCEFDDYLLRRSGARLFLNTPLKQLERAPGVWIVNNEIRNPMLVGAGGTFCPVARFLGARINREVVVAAQEAEFAMDPGQLAACTVRGEVPELYFCADMKGYGWCFRKQNVLNIGLGRLDSHGLAGHVADFLQFLRTSGKLAANVEPAFRGHAYLLYGRTARAAVDEGVLLIGDAAGVAYAQSGEGIRPAVESGLMAAKAIASAQGLYTPERLDRYREALTKRFGEPATDWAARIGQHLPTPVIASLARQLLATNWFTRDVVLDRWFLHRHEPALSV